METNKLISAVVIFAIALALIFIFVMPKYNELLALQATLAQKQAEYNSKSVYYGKISDEVKNIQSRADVTEKINAALPSAFSYANVVYFLQQSASANGLDIKSLVFSPITLTNTDANTNSNVKSVGITLDVGGTYPGFKAFLASLDKSERLFEVDSINFSASQNETSQAAVTQPVSGPAASGNSGQTQVQAPAQAQYDVELNMKIYTY